MRSRPRYKDADPPLPIDPGRFYRKSEVARRRLLGYAISQLDEKIKAGEIDPPVSLSDTGRGTGYYGNTILKIQAEQQAKAKAKSSRA